jgi:glycosyltransferase involved in cell wall biosynthesis
MREAGFKQLERFSGLALGQATLEAYAQAAGAPARKSSSKKRLALWTPLPPQASGVSDYSVELLEQLEVDYDIEVFVDHGYLPNLRLLDQHTLHDYSGFARRQKERPFDVIIYQLGASSFHAYMREAIERWPGLVVVHDLSWSYWIRDHFLKHGGRRGFEAELERQEGTQALRTYRDLHRLGWFIGREALWHFLDHHYLLGEVIRKSRAMAVHLPHSQKALEQHYGVSGIHCLPLGTRDPWKGAKSGFRPEARAARQIDASTFVAGAFGLGSRGKRWDSILRAFAQFHQRRPDSLLLLVGAVPNQGYAREIRRWIVRLGLEMSVRWIDRADEEAFTEWMEVCDVVVNLRHPSRQQMSAVACRALGAGKPLILTDLPEWDIFPSAVCLRTPPSAEEIPLLVEHFETLFQSPARRGEMGAAARTFYLQSFHPTLAAREYRQLIEELSQPTRPDLKPGVGV